MRGRVRDCRSGVEDVIGKVARKWEVIVVLAFELESSASKLGSVCSTTELYSLTLKLLKNWLRDGMMYR